MERFGGNPFAASSEGARNLEQQKKALHEKIARLLQGVPLREVARLLGAEDLIEIVRIGRQAPVKRLNVEAFVERELKRGNMLRLPDSITKLEMTIVPPDEGEMIRQGEGDAPFREKRIFPRSHHLVEILTVLKEPYSITTGTNGKDMMRGESYQMFSIPGLQRIVLVNDEEGNATFIISADDPDEMEHLMTQTKNELRSLGDEKMRALHYPGDPGKWKAELLILLQEPFADSLKKKQRPRGKDANAEVAVAPDGWMNERNLALYLGISRNKTAVLVERNLTECPEWVEMFRNERNHILEYYHPDLIEACKEYLTSLPPEVPDGWKTNAAMARELSVNQQTTQRLIESEGAAHPEWTAKYRTPDGHINVFVSPELSARITENIRKRIAPPEGWKIAMQLVDASRAVRRPHVVEIAERYREEHPKWFRLYANPKRMLEEHYHPDLIKLIEDELRQKPERAPEGWMMMGTLAKELGVDVSMVERIARLHATGHSEWLKMYGSISGDRIHMHPDLIRSVRREIEEREKPPEGWKGWTTIAREAGTDPLTVRRLVDREFAGYRATHPEWFKTYTDPNGRLADFLHPELVGLIVTQLTRRETAPSGWATILRISSDMKEEAESTGADIVTSRTLIKKLIEEYRTNNPDWFKDYKTPSQKYVYTEHYHPDLVRLIKQRLRRGSPRI